MVMADPDDIRCPKCGAMYALVGRSHNCNAPPTIGKIPEKKGRLVPPAKPMRKTRVKAKTKKDKFDRLKYQREYMRKRRAQERKKA